MNEITLDAITDNEPRLAGAADRFEVLRELLITRAGCRLPRNLDRVCRMAGVYIESKDLIRRTFVFDDRESNGGHGPPRTAVWLALKAGSSESYRDISGHEEETKGTIEVQ